MSLVKPCFLSGNFTSSLLKTVLSDDLSRSNLFLSPFSISFALSMAMAGAGGQTKSQMLETLGYQDCEYNEIHLQNRDLMKELSDSDSNIKVANRIFVRQGFQVLQPFLDVLSNMYSAALTILDFSNASKAAQEVNMWVSESTNGKIPTLVTADNFNPFLAMIIANAIYFKSSWVKPFDSKYTHLTSFHLIENESVTVNMMYQKNQHYVGFHESTNCKVLELPYAGNKIKMIIFLPKEMNGLQRVVDAFGPSLIREAQSNLTQNKTEIWLPKFKLEENYSLGEALQKMGMTDAFSSGQADFSGITGGRDLFIGQVIHKTFVEVNEEGTEAAAATGVMMMKRSLNIEETVRFRCDHPFLFAILNSESNNILFAGCLMKPESVQITHSEL